jgi:hypothetical protein
MGDYLYRIPAKGCSLTPRIGAERFAAEYWNEPRKVTEMHAVGDKFLWQFSVSESGDYQCQFVDGYLVIERLPDRK